MKVSAIYLDNNATTPVDPRVRTPKEAQAVIPNVRSSVRTIRLKTIPKIIPKKQNSLPHFRSRLERFAYLFCKNRRIRTVMLVAVPMGRYHNPKKAAVISAPRPQG